MNRNKLFGLALSSVFVLATAVGATNHLNSADFSKQNHTRQAHKHNAYSGSDFSDAVEIGRDEITVDIQSLTSTPASKSATIVFNSSRLTGWGTSKKNVYVVIDDEDFSGTPSNPSLSGTKQPVFNGYTIEMANIATFTFSYKDESTKETVKWTDLLVPETLTYGDSFSIQNSKIVSSAFVFADSIDESIDAAIAKLEQDKVDGKLDDDEFEEEKADAISKYIKFDYLVIPDGITEIESGAFKNVPTYLKGIRCEATSKPAGWADDWCDALSAQIEWGYQLKGEETTGKKTGNETNQLTQTTGTNTNYYGELVNAAANETNSLFSIVNDVNWTGNFDSPVRSTAGLTSPYHLEGYVALIEDVPANANIVIPTQLAYKSNLVIENKTISSKTLEFVLEDDDSYNGNIQSITIPSGFVVEANAFKNVPSTVKFYCEDPKMPETWAANWIDLTSEEQEKQITWGATVSATSKTSVVANTDRQFRLGNDATTYILGYKHSRTEIAALICDSCGKYISGDVVPENNICPLCKETTTFTSTSYQDVRPKMNKPLVVYYEVKNKENNSVREVWYEMPLVSEEPTSESTASFDSVKSSAHSRSLDILIDENEELLVDSFCIYNIFRSKTVKVKGPSIDVNGDLINKYNSYIVPDDAVTFYAKAEKRYDKEININDVINYRFNGLTKFNDFTMTSMYIDKVLPSYWHTGIAPDVRNSFLEFLEDGSYSIRYAFYNINNAFYRLTYYSPTAKAEITTTIPIKTPNSVSILSKDKNNNVAFLLKNSDVYYQDASGKVIRDFKCENLRQFELLGITINIHLWNNAQAIKVGRTDLSIHFGAVDVMPYSANGASAYNINTFILVFCLIFTAVFVGLAIALYFYLKEKFKNDEFRRMRTKSYVKSAIAGYLGMLVVALAIIFICFRFGRFNNAVSVHNPLDIFIVIPGIISIVVIGYFIRFVVVKIKTERQRKKAKKLKLNEDVDDDGTH